MGAGVRFFTNVVRTGGEPHLGRDYLYALEAAGIPVRALSLDGTSLFAMLDEWRPLAPLFATPMEERYVNVVCAPVGLQIAAEQRARDLYAANQRGLSGAEVAREHGLDPEQIVVEERTVFAGLYTVGVKNVAITMPPALERRDRNALELYDYRLAPDCEAADGVQEELVAPVWSVPPESFAEFLRVENLLP